MKIIKKFLVLNTKLDSEFKNMAYYNTTFGQMDSDAWAKIYVLAHLLLVNNKVIELQYKILFRFVVKNKLLYQIQIKTTPNCPICEIDTQTIEHLFFECKKIKTLWLQIIDLWNKYNNTRVILSVKDVILGYIFQDLKSSKALNTIILLSKYYIYTSYITEKNISLKSFFIKLKQYVDIFKSLKTKDLALSVVETIESFINW